MPSPRQTKICSVPGCTNNPSKTKHFDPPVHFYHFPWRDYETERRKKWIEFCRKNHPEGSNWNPMKHYWICSRHFVGNEKSDIQFHPSYVPTIRSSQKFPAKKEELKLKRFERFMKRREQAILSSQQDEMKIDAQNAISSIKIANTFTLSDTYIQRRSNSKKFKFNSYFVQTVEHIIYGELKMFMSVTLPSETQPSKNDSATLVDHAIRDPYNHKEVQTDRMAPNNVINQHKFNYDSIKRNEVALQRLTSVSREVFEFLLQLLPRATFKYNSFPVEDQLLLTLMRLRLGLSGAVLCVFFGVHEKTANRVFYKILSQLATRTKEWIAWPQSFKNPEQESHECDSTCKTGRIIVECFEVKTDRPSTPELQNFMWSESKKSHTVRYLVGFTQGGIISYKSRAYGGGTADELMAADCGVPNESERLFPTTLCEKNLVVEKPSYVDSKMPQFRSQEVDDYAKNQNAKKTSGFGRLERGMNRLSVFHILTNRVLSTLISETDNIFHVCCVITNMKILKNVDDDIATSSN